MQQWLTKTVSYCTVTFVLCACVLNALYLFTLGLFKVLHNSKVLFPI